MKKISLKITALLLGWMSFSALAEQTVDIEIRGIKGERAIRNTDMNVNVDVLPDGLPNDDSLCITVLGFALNDDGTMKDELVGRLQTDLQVLKNIQMLM